MHKVVSNGRITLIKTATEDVQATEAERHDYVQLKTGNTGDEYIEERIVRHEDDHEETKYLVRWYSYGPTENTWERSHHIPQHFIKRYWEHQRRVRQ